MKANLAAHIPVGEHLVPGRKSLLREAGRGRGEQVSVVEHGLFDAFFLARRDDVDTAGLAAQVSERLTQIITDIAAVPLHRLARPVVRRLAHDAGASLAAAPIR